MIDFVLLVGAVSSLAVSVALFEENPRYAPLALIVMFVCLYFFSRGL